MVLIPFGYESLSASQGLLLGGSSIYFERKVAFGRHLSHTLASLAKKIRSGLDAPANANW